MSNIRGLFDNKKDDDNKRQEYSNGNGIAVQSQAAQDFDGLVAKAKAGGDAGKGDSKTDVKITLYNNGFQIDDEEFRDYEAPENKKFIEEMKSGYVPQELAQKYKR